MNCSYYWRNFLSTGVKKNSECSQLGYNQEPWQYAETSKQGMVVSDRSKFEDIFFLLLVKSIKIDLAIFFMCIPIVERLNLTIPLLFLIKYKNFFQHWQKIGVIEHNGKTSNSDQEILSLIIFDIIFFIILYVKMGEMTLGATFLVPTTQI